MDIEKLLIASYNSLTINDTNKNYETYFLIIQIKKDNIHFSNVQQSIYLDIKYFIDNYILSARSRDYGYDNINLQKIYFAINCENILGAKYELTNHTIRLLKSNSYDDLADVIKIEKLKFKLKIILSKKGLAKYFEALFLLTSYNLLSIIISLLILLVITLLLMQNAVFKIFEFYDFSYEKFSKYHFINQILNVIAKPMGLAENFKIKSLNEFSLILLIFLKSLYLLIVSNYLYEKIKENLIK